MYFLLKMAAFNGYGTLGLIAESAPNRIQQNAVLPLALDIGERYDIYLRAVGFIFTDAGGFTRYSFTRNQQAVGKLQMGIMVAPSCWLACMHC